MDTLLSMSEAARRLGVSRQTVYDWIEAKKLPTVLGPAGQRRIREADLFTQTPAQVIAVAHHAGGVGKTTTASNLAYGLAQAGRRVCVIDLDPQGDLSSRLHVTPAAPTLAEALLNGAATPALAECGWGATGFALIPASLETMAGVELGLVAVVNGRERRLARLVAPLRASYDTILLDCPPNLNLLTSNAFYAADAVLIPVQAHDKAYHQLGALFNSIREVNEYRAPAPPLRVLGLLLTMVDKRASMAGEVEAALREAYGALVFATTIPLRTDAAADRRYQAPLGVYAPQNAAARAYAALAEEVIQRG